MYTHRNPQRHSLPLAHSLRVDMMLKRCEVSVTIAFRVAKVLDTAIYDVSAGTAVASDTCHHCCHHCGKEPNERRDHVRGRRGVGACLARPPIAGV